MISLIASVAGFFLSAYLGVVNPRHLEPTSCGEKGIIRYCYYAGSSDSKRLVYFVHGFAMDEAAWTWSRVAGRIEETWKKNHVKRPHLIVMSMGKLWWNVRPESSEEMTEFTRLVEKGLNLAPKERIVWGESMGGHNVLRWAMDWPELFSRVALTCPAIPLSFQDPGDKDQGVWPFNRVADLLISGHYRDANALNPLAETKVIGNRYPETLLIVSSVDHFGFYAGGMALAEKLKKLAPVHFEEQKIPHCLVDVKDLAKFLGQ